MADWGALLAAAPAARDAVTAMTYLKSWSTASHPALFGCDDGREYVVKGAQNSRMLVNDQVVARLGRMLGAPTGEPAYVVVPPELIAAEQALSHFRPGIGHGTLWIRGCTEREHIMHFREPANRARFAQLAVLYGLCGAHDHQFIYANEPPNLVYSVDHGHFFPGGPGWTACTLASAGPAVPDAEIKNVTSMTEDELRSAAAKLSSLDDAALAHVIVSLPPDWGCDASDQEALASYLASRRDALLAAFATPTAKIGGP